MVRTATDSLDAALDDALEMTFPASDPVAIFMADPGRGAVAPGQGAAGLADLGGCAGT